jgi:hypothetical protein
VGRQPTHRLEDVVIYDRPVSELMQDAAAELCPPFKVRDVVGWFETHYPKIRRNTIAAHIRGMTSNDPNRHHHAWLAAKAPVFFRREDGLLERFDPDQHMGEREVAAAAVVAEDGALAEDLSSEGAAEFVLESQLEAFLMGNWRVIGWGRPLEVWQGSDGVSGHQFVTAVGRRLDFLCVDTATRALVVVELKRGQPSDKVVGQVARYIGWSAPTSPLRGRSSRVSSSPIRRTTPCGTR